MTILVVDCGIFVGHNNGQRASFSDPIAVIFYGCLLCLERWEWIVVTTDVDRL